MNVLMTSIKGKYLTFYIFLKKPIVFLQYQYTMFLRRKDIFLSFNLGVIMDSGHLNSVLILSIYVLLSECLLLYVYSSYLYIKYMLHNML